MDALIKRFDVDHDGELSLCLHRGVAYQTDMRAGRVPYDETYVRKVEAYEGTPIASAVNEGRVALLKRYLERRARVLDIGCGTGAFMRLANNSKLVCKGMEVLPSIAQAMRRGGTFADNPADFDAVTMWDVIEHLDVPHSQLKRITRGAYVFISIPVFDDLRRIRESKHYRPGEHLYYWTARGFTDWMAMYGFRLVETSDHETKAGRDSIGAFAFCKDLPEYHDYVAAYKHMHSTGHYGSSAVDLHFERIAKAVLEVNPKSILDYGCGRSDLAAYFWNDGARRIYKYDPAIAMFDSLPEDEVDMVLCTDMLEHVPMASVDRVLTHIRSKGKVALFTISLKPARAKLPSGENAHVTLLLRKEWKRWVAEYFGSVREITTQWETELMLLAGNSPK